MKILNGIIVNFFVWSMLVVIFIVLPAAVNDTDAPKWLINSLLFRAAIIVDIILLPYIFYLLIAEKIK